jgi:hypothetical protein
MGLAWRGRTRITGCEKRRRETGMRPDPPDERSIARPSESGVWSLRCVHGYHPWRGQCSGFGSLLHEVLPSALMSPAAVVSIPSGTSLVRVALLFG